MRVLVTIDALGSALPYGLDLARGLSRLGIETILALTGPGASAAQLATASAISGAQVVQTGLPPARFAADAAALRRTGEEIARLADERGADLIQLSTPALAAGTRFGVPVIALQHGCAATWWEAVQGGEPPPAIAAQAALVRAGLEAADMAVAPTAAFADATRRVYGLDEAPRVVHNGRSPSPPPRLAPRDFVFTAGRLWDEGKNLEMLDAAAGRIPVPVRAAGPIEGPGGTKVLFDNIDCLGDLETEDLAAWLSARPVFVSAAVYEPFGLAVLEAASAGCPLVLSDIPAFRELWEEVAIFVPARDEEAFTRAIADLVADDFERAVMGRAAKERAGLYTADAMAAQMAAIYRSLLPAVRRPVLAAQRTLAAA